VKPYQNSTAALPEGMRVKAPTRDLSGQRFGRLQAQRVVGRHSNNSLIWLCTCDCGEVVERTSASLCKRPDATASCGCYLREISRERLVGQTPWNKGERYSARPDGYVYGTRRAWAKAVKREHGEACERCGWAEAACDVHHKTPRYAGGLNTVANGVVLCPNCHRTSHGVPLQ
jgi:hypothetical protein